MALLQCRNCFRSDIPLVDFEDPLGGVAGHNGRGNLQIMLANNARVVNK